MIIEYWIYDNKKNTYSSSSYAPLSAFPTIVNIEKHLVFVGFITVGNLLQHSVQTNYKLLVEKFMMVLLHLKIQSLTMVLK